MGTLHTLTGCIFLLAFIVKLALHFYLERLQNSSTSPAAIFLFPKNYLLPYRKMVDEKHSALKFFCNLLFIIAIVALVANIVVGILLL